MATIIVINGQNYPIDLSTLPPDITLNTFIRENAQLTATKYMCLEGGCGACICVIKRKHALTNEIQTFAVNSCLALLNTCIDAEIVTLEGIGNKNIGYHPIQKRLAEMNGTQCGYCTPGFVMNMFALLEANNNNLTMSEIENGFGGNICRCTGYRPILDAMKSFAVDSTITLPDTCQVDIEDIMVNKKTCSKTGSNCQRKCFQQQLNYKDDAGAWYWPKTLTELFDVINNFPENEEYMLVAGNTAHGVYRRSPYLKHFIDIHGIPELHQQTMDNNTLTLGANLSLTETMQIFKNTAHSVGFEYCSQLWEHFDLIANVPVRNMGTLAGNIQIKKMYPDFPSDVFVTFEALDVQVVVNENATTQKILSLSDYLNKSSPKSVIIAFQLKAYSKNDFIFKSYKIMPRAQNAHAYVNAAFLIGISSGKVTAVRLVLGGISKEFAHATSVESLIVGKDLYDSELLAKVFTELKKVIEPEENLPDTSPEYRRKLACGLFYKFLISIAPIEEVNKIFKSGGDVLKRILSSGIQSYDTNKNFYPVTKAVHKLEALLQCSGEAYYMNDTLTAGNTVYCAFVDAKKVGASIERIDANEALKMPGVLSFFSSKDIPGINSFTTPTWGYELEEIFVANKVKFYNQPIGIVVATTNDAAQRAALKVKVIYYNHSEKDSYYKVLATMDDVFEANMSERIKLISSFGTLTNMDNSIHSDISGKGILQLGLQYHFSMEPQTTVAVPFEQGLQVWCATQWMDHTQTVIAKMLDLPVNGVQLKVRRLGGAYGCKITRGNLVACAAALAAFKLNRPVRFVQSIESMMNVNGKRWACRSDYEFQVKPNGKIIKLKNDFYQDAGCTLNENPVEGHSDVTARNCYKFDANSYKIKGSAVLTDAPSSTWCRAPGSLEGIAMIETILEHIAFECNIDPADARLTNIDTTHKMHELLPRFLSNSEYNARRKEIDNYNETNRWRKRGIGLAIMDYPVLYGGQFTATVSIYHADGSVVITHGGIEMGQGINTKVAQVAAYWLGVPFETIKIESSDTINGANSIVTGGAVGSESVCFAVRKCCKTLNERLETIKKTLPKSATWLEIMAAAFNKNIHMTASEQYKAGDLAEYNVYGLALCEVEVDILTGQQLIKRVDILEDAGESLSPLIDVGQVEGAFVMALGYWLTESLVYDRQTGELKTNRTWNYKPPGAKDIPIDFRIELLQKNPNSGGFMRSKATGEPPSCLAVSSVFALQHALQSARKDAGLKREWVRLGAPTTPETIVLNAGHDIQQFVLK